MSDSERTHLSVQTEPQQHFKSGAKRSGEANRTQFALLCPYAEKRLAMTSAEGLEKYGPDNWSKGLPINDTLNHVMRHVNAFRLGDSGEDHLAHAMWGLMAIIHFHSNCKCHSVRQEFFAQSDAQYLNDQIKRNI